MNISSSLYHERSVSQHRVARVSTTQTGSNDRQKDKKRHINQLEGFKLNAKIKIRSKTATSYIKRELIYVC